jgi:hypothetical protein
LGLEENRFSLFARNRNQKHNPPQKEREGVKWKKKKIYKTIDWHKRWWQNWITCLKKDFYV